MSIKPRREPGIVGLAPLDRPGNVIGKYNEIEKNFTWAKHVLNLVYYLYSLMGTADAHQLLDHLQRA